MYQHHETTRFDGKGNPVEIVRRCDVKAIVARTPFKSYLLTESTCSSCKAKLTHITASEPVLTPYKAGRS